MPRRLTETKLYDMLIDFAQWLFFLPSAILFFTLRFSKDILPDAFHFEPQEEILLFLAAATAAGAVDVIKRDFKRKFDELEEGLRNSSFNFVSGDDQDGRLANRLSGFSEAEVIDSRPTAMPESKRYLKERTRLLRSKRLAMWRIAVVHDLADLQAVEKLAEKHKNDKLYIACLNAKSREIPPLVPLIILGKQEVHLGQALLPGDNLASSQHIGILHRGAAAKFHESFGALWQRAKVVKDIRGIDLPALEELRRELIEQSLSIRVYKDDASQDFQDLVKLIQEEQRGVDIVSHPTLDWVKPGRRNYYGGLAHSIETGTRHRRIVWNRTHLAFLSQWLAEYPQLENAAAPLEIRFFNAQPTDDFFHFDVLGERIVILYLSVGTESWVKVEDRGFSALMQSNFDKLWYDCRDEVLKAEGQAFDKDRFNALYERLGGEARLTSPAAAGASPWRPGTPWRRPAASVSPNRRP